MLLFLIGCFQIDGDDWDKWSEENSNTNDSTVTFQQEAMISSDVEVATDVELTCSASGVDGSGTVIEPTYLWKKGTIELSNQNTYVVRADDTDVGDTITCIATITNANGNIATSEDSATINNTEPVILGVDIIPDPAYNDSSLACSAEISDPDEDLEAEYSWEIGGEQFATGSTVELVQYVNLEILPTQLIDCIASVSDSEGAEDSDTGTITIGNRAPLVENISISSASFEVNAEVSCSAGVSDPDGEQLVGEYSWTMDEADLAIATESFTLSPQDAPVGGVLSCTVYVEDGYSGSHFDTVSETIQNTPPEVTQVSISPNTGVYADSVLSCSAAGLDLNDGDLTPSYVWTNGANQLGTTETLSLDFSIASPNDILTCTASVTDENAETASLGAAVSVLNTPPVVYNVSVSSSGSIYTGTELTCSANATDLNDGDVSSLLTYEWSANGASIGTGTTYIVDASQTDVGDNIVCTAFVTDFNGASGQEVADVTVENTAPVINGLPLVSNSSPEIGDTITCSATATDIDEDNINYTYQWFDISGQFLDSSDSFTVSNLAVGEQLVCEVIVDDGMDSSGSSSSSFVTVQNTIPEINNLQITPNIGITSSSLLSCSATATDINDGDLSSSIVYSWASSNGSSGVGSEWQLDNSLALPNDTISCTAEVTDGNGATASISSSSLTIENSAPLVSNLEISSSEGDAFTGSELTCSGTASDSDEGDLSSSVTYEWFTNGNLIGSGEIYTINASETDVGDNIDCTASVIDSLGAQAEESSSIQIENTAPTVSNVQISSASGEYYNDETITCTADVYDPDDTPTIYYDWAHEGTNLFSGATLDLSITSLMPNDVLVCNVGVTDFTASDSDSTGITIGNREPSEPTAAISWSGSGSEPSDMSDLTCVGEGSVDPDGETVSYTLSWASSFGQIASGGSLSSSQTLPSEEWVCQVEVSDGTASGFGEESIIINSKSWMECPIEQNISEANYIFTGLSEGGQTGLSVELDGDVDGDGLSDILISSPHAGGQVHLFLSSLVGVNFSPDLSNAHYTFSSEQAGDFLGVSTSFADVDGDGLDDILIGAQGNDDTALNAGKVYLFFGSSILGSGTASISVADADIQFLGETEEDNAGWSVTGMGDVDGDNLEDIFIGAPSYDSSFGTNAGKGYLFFASSLSNTSINLSSADRVFLGEKDQGFSSYAVASAGDVDGDGLDDMILGLPKEYDVVWASGKAYLFLSTSIMNASTISNLSDADYIFTGAESGDYTGAAVASAGDVDGDGLDDILIGGDQAVGLGIGKAHLILAASLGSFSAINLANVGYTFLGDQNASGGEYSVSLAGGDVDGDGLSDVLIGFSVDNTMADDSGAGYLFLAASLGSDTSLDVMDADLSFYGEGASTNFGISVSMGDTDGDGIKEFLIGANGDDEGGNNRGKAVLYSACEFVNDPPTEPEISISWGSGEDTPSDDDDLLCSATGSIDPQGFNVSYSYSWESSLGAIVSGAVVSASETSLDEQWTCIVEVSDGLETTIVMASAWIYSTFWEYCEQTQTLGEAQYQFIGEAVGDLAGYSVSSAGDIDGDGVDDLLIGAEQNDDGGSNAGKAYLFLASSLTSGSVMNLSAADYVFVGREVDGELARVISSAGDVDGDGLDDVLLSELSTVSGNDNVGKVYLFLGASILSGSVNINPSDADYEFVGENSQDYAISLSSAGDIDGDGLSDILIGAMHYDANGFSNTGKAYLILGSSLGVNSEISLSTADYSFIGENDGDNAGVTLSSAGDVDGDGLDDILIGARYNADGGTQAGKVYLFFGSSLGAITQLPLSTADYFFIGEEVGDLAGQSLSGGEDVDGDGLDDILIGARHGDGLTDKGKSYLIFASSLGLNTILDLSFVDYSFLGEADSDWSGYDVSLVGDVEGDGLSDILISASRNDDGGNNAGKTYLVLGASLGSVININLSNADYSFMGDGDDDQAAVLAKTVGDINGDGRADIFIGAPENVQGGAAAGKVGVFTACDYVEYPPTEPEISLSWTSGNYPILETDELVCSASGSVDPNGDSVVYSYSWESDSGAIVAGATVSASETSIYEQWTCTATAFDNSSTSSSTESITVGCGSTNCDVNIDLGDGITIDMVSITAGTEPSGRYYLVRDFDIMTTLVTQGMFFEIMGYQAYAGEGISGSSSGDNFPAYNSSWHMAADFANHLTALYNNNAQTSAGECYSCQNTQTTGVTCTEGLDPYVCDGFRLPTEAEWEFAARSGSPENYWTPNGGGDISSNSCNGDETIEDGSQNPPLLGDYVWYCGNNAGNGPPEVAEKLSNGFGLYDMNGLLYEWTQDWYGCSFPNQTEAPYCSTAGTERVSKGGYWAFNAINTRTSYRAGYEPADRSSIYGFRLVMGQ